jgi:phage-related protein
MNGKPLRWLHGEVKTPPMTVNARREIGFLLRQLQDGETLEMPHSRPMPEIGPRCHELRVKDAGTEWRVMYRTDSDAILVVDVFSKKTRETPPDVIRNCQRRLRAYEGDNP